MYKTGRNMPAYLSLLLEHSLRALDIGSMLEKRLSFDGRTLTITNREGRILGSHEIDNGKVILIALGKASQSMTKSMMKVMGERVSKAIVVFPEDQNLLLEPKDNITVIPSSHPVPSNKSILAARVIKEALSGLSSSDTAIFLISGGGSSLVEEPIQGISLDELVRTYSLLLSSGANIKEVNTVRKHISSVKGGRLAELAHPAKVIALIASDVPGNDESFIASGPTAPDPTTYQDALEILKFYELEEEVPSAVLNVLRDGAMGKLQETPKPGDHFFSNTWNYIVASPFDLAKAVEERARQLGFNAYVLTTRIEGESRELAKAISSVALDTLKGFTSFQRPAVLILAGEPSVKVRGRGKGGRATELIAWLSREIDGARGISAFAIDTDGKDGSSDAAGAFADWNTWSELVRIFGRKVIQMLNSNDSFSVLDSTGYTIRTGPTGSNLNNLICLIIE